MKKAILVVDYYGERQDIITAHPALKDAPFILTTIESIPDILEPLEKGIAHCFDDKISPQDVEWMAETVHQAVWNWFRDEQGVDLSRIDDCSLGSVFAISIEMLFHTILRYRVGLEKILQSDMDVYCADNTEEILLAVLQYLSSTIGFRLQVVKTSHPRKNIPWGRGLENYDGPFWRTQNLGDTVPHTTWFDAMLGGYLRWMQRKIKKERTRILIAPGGKLNEFIARVKNNNSTTFEFVVPIRKRDAGRLPLIRFEKTRYYYFYATERKGDRALIVEMLKRLRVNLAYRIDWIDPNLLIRFMDHYVFPYWLNIYSYYRNLCQWLAMLTPDLIVIGADAEIHAALGYAAKRFNIPTIFFPHGLRLFGTSGYLSGPERIFDHCFALGKKDQLDYQSQGVEKERIHIVPLPYFGKFLPKVPKSSTHYRSAIILLQDYNSWSPGAKIQQVLRGVLDAIDVLEDLDITVVGMKARVYEMFARLGLTRRFFESQGRNIELFFGYSNFPEIARKVDCIVGPMCSAVIEADLLGKDYYVYTPYSREAKGRSFPRSIEEIVRIARSPKELRENIINRTPYNDGHSVKDLLDLEGIVKNEDIYRKFEAVLREIFEYEQGSSVLAIRQAG